MSARTLLVAGTASHVGKSTVVAGLCRLLADQDVSVAPFKAQNMSNNARAAPRTVDRMRQEGGGGGADVADDTEGADVADDTEGADSADDSEDTDDAFGEIGVSQYVQARAARIPPSTDHNPVLLKPRGDGESQLVLDGVAIGHFAAGAYYDTHWDRALETAQAAYDRVAADHDVVIMEGAGSIAEINLHHRDLSNVELPRYADADILLVADIERGGVFASLVGTLDLMPPDLRERVVGCLITKFRGDVSLLDPGLEAFEERTDVPVVGVLPHDDPGLPEEDSVALPDEETSGLHGGDDGVADDRSVTVAVPRFPRLSNATDLEPLARVPGVRVRYQPLDRSLDDADAVVLPGTKNTVDDLQAANAAGFQDELRSFRGPVVGLCGGYQMLGERVVDAGYEGTGSGDSGTTLDGFGLLPVETVFRPEKTVVQVERTLRPIPVLGGATGRVAGYEIHAGETTHLDPVERPFQDGDGATVENVLGTYLHGLFENPVSREGFVDAVFDATGIQRPPARTGAASSFDRAAQLLADHVDAAFVEDLAQTRN